MKKIDPRTYSKTVIEVAEIRCTACDEIYYEIDGDYYENCPHCNNDTDKYEPIELSTREEIIYAHPKTGELKIFKEDEPNDVGIDV